MNQPPVSPIIAKAFEIAEKHLGIDDLCRLLRVPDSTIRNWATGVTPMPGQKLLKLVEILHELDPNWIEQTKNKSE
jgi:DNA-binding transcriptional regulator YiaG